MIPGQPVGVAGFLALIFPLIKQLHSIIFILFKIINKIFKFEIIEKVSLYVVTIITRLI